MSGTCHACKGTGTVDCPKCKGKGYQHEYSVLMQKAKDTECGLCSGSGKKTCPNCDGRGK